MLVEHFAHVAILLFDRDLDTRAVLGRRLARKALEHQRFLLERVGVEVANDQPHGCRLPSSLQYVRVHEALVAVGRFRRHVPRQTANESGRDFDCVHEPVLCVPGCVLKPTKVSVIASAEKLSNSRSPLVLPSIV
jgi:hypothetical protein